LTEIVGVVGDVHERLDTDAQPVMYQLPAQIPDADMALINSYETAAVLVRTRPGVPASSVGPAVRQVLAANVQLPTANTRTMDRVSLDSTAQRNFEVLLLAVFACLAVLLASAGIYGVMSYSVEQRTREIGIRAALGAQSRDTLRLILRQALRMAITGVIIGLAAAFELTRFLGAELFGVKSSDPFTFAAVPLILITVALAAAWIPALRAVRVDPLTALRHE
jgi:putative ABC transport system permease protein